MPYGKRIKTVLPVILTIIVNTLICIFITSCYLPGPPLGANPTPTPTPRLMIADQPPSSLTVTTNYPTTMQVGHTYFISVTLSPKGQQLLSDLIIEQATPTTSNPLPIGGTPGATLGNAFGPQYEPKATATLSPGDGPFKITPIGPVEQSLDQPQVIWKWSIIPQDGGADYLSVDIEATWRSSSGDERGPYPLSSKLLSIDSQLPPADSEPFISFSPMRIDFGSPINSAIGAGILGIAGILGLWLKNKFSSKKKPSRRRR